MVKEASFAADCNLYGAMEVVEVQKRGENVFSPLSTYSSISSPSKPPRVSGNNREEKVEKHESQLMVCEILPSEYDKTFLLLTNAQQLWLSL